MEPHHVAGKVMRHGLISSVYELICGLEEFSAERRTVRGETVRALLSLLPLRFIIVHCLNIHYKGLIFHIFQLLLISRGPEAVKTSLNGPK